MKHQVLVGDCLDKLPEVSSASVQLICTSPPYAQQRKATYGGIHPDKYVEWFLPRSAEFLRILKPDGSFVLNIKENVVDGERHTYVLDLIKALKEQGWLWTEEYIWHKKNATPGKWPNRFRDAWERCLHFTKQKKFKMRQERAMVPIGDWAKNRLDRLSDQDKSRHESQTGSGVGRRVANWAKRDLVYPPNVLYMAVECGNQRHSAAFPEALPRWFLRLFSDPGDLVLDPFLGSGTTGVAAIQLGRRILGMELSSEYAQIAVQRMDEALFCPELESLQQEDSSNLKTKAVVQPATPFDLSDWFSSDES